MASPIPDKEHARYRLRGVDCIYCGTPVDTESCVSNPLCFPCPNCNRVYLVCFECNRIGIEFVFCHHHEFRYQYYGSPSPIDTEENILRRRYPLARPEEIRQEIRRLKRIEQSENDRYRHAIKRDDELQMKYGDPSMIIVEHFIVEHFFEVIGVGWRKWWKRILRR